MRRQIAAALAAATAFVLVGPPGGTPSRAAPSGDELVSAAPTWVTLITGDRVAVRMTGGRTVLNVEPARRAQPVSFQEFVHAGDSYLVPGDAAGMVQSGLLDRELFNVTGLVRQGYDDAHVSTVPLLVQHTDGAAATRAAPPAGSTVRRALPEFGMTALDEQKASATQFWAGLVTGQRTRASGGVSKVWLNARMHANLDESVPQINAPAAWESGLTGHGVRVAVLDTGIDTDHPDLAGKVDVSKDFSGKGSVEDGFGHGTHVASTIVGSGAASGGKYKGVAPDATLAVGKVLDDTGGATWDTIIAGMEWAAAETGAKVVNMSLGGNPGSDGTDPVSAAANSLAQQYGTLFVVSAGNDGRDRTVGSPAAADAALAVGSVSKQDSLSPFSSRGPRGGDGALKPEIAAPGGSIVAARPAGVTPLGEPVGDAYQRLDGTSMAAPHVAGSAAILAQQHPDWTPALLKDALVSSAVPIEGAGPYGVGAGRVDVARATSTPVVATGSVSANLPWPNEGTQQKQTVTWHNSGAEPVTLDLRADGLDGLVTLSASSVTVPAGASASVGLTVTARPGKEGTHSGVLTASTADGAITTRTALSAHQEAEAYDLTVSAIDRDGNPVPGDDRAPVTVINLDTGAIQFGGPGTYRLPRGRYTVNSDIRTPRQDAELSYSFISQPEFVLDRDITQVLDGRDGVRFSAEPDNAAAHGGTQSIHGLNNVRDCACTFGFVLDLDPRFHEVYAATVPGTRSDGFAIGLQRRATEPTLELTANDGQPFDVQTDWLEQGPAESVTLPVAHGGAGTPEDLAKIDATGRLVVIDVAPGTPRDEWFRRVDNVKTAGGKLAMLNFLDTTTSLARADDEQPPLFTVPTMYALPGSVTAARLVAYAKTPGATVSYTSRPFTDLRYELAYGVEGQVTTQQVHRPRTRDLAEVRTAYHDNAAGEVRPFAEWQFFGRTISSIYPQPAASGQVRKEYFTPGTWDLRWTSGWWGELTDTRKFVVGPRNEIAWNKAVVSPSLRGLTQTYIGEEPRPRAWRKDDTFDLALAMYGDAAGRPRQLAGWEGVTGSISLYRDGALVQTVPDPTWAVFPAPAADSAYRLTAESHKDGPLWTTVSSEWTFRSSSAADRKALPLLTARFAPGVNVHNQAPGGRAFSFPAYVERQDGAAKVRTLTVEISYDDGATWQPTTVRRTGDHWKVGVQHPPTGYASLRATATDTDGNTVRQTVLRAYQIGS